MWCLSSHILVAEKCARFFKYFLLEFQIGNFQQTGRKMPHPFLAPASDPCGMVLRAATLLLVASASLGALAQQPTIHIKVINAVTNQPIADERLNVAIRTNQIGSVAMATDKTGNIDVVTGKDGIVRILANMYADCRPRGELYTNYSVATILKTGITTGNLCSTASPAAKPGVLILFETPKTYIPSYPAPPLPPPPHSN
jgi:hypothetical protein